MNLPALERSDLALVGAIRERGSLAGAALALGVVPSVVSKRLVALEQRLGQQLFDRTTRRLSATTEGETVLRHAQALLAGFAALESELAERQQELEGTLRIAATLGFGRHWVGPTLAAFNELHPGLAIQLVLTENLPELNGFDGAIWLGAPRQRGHQSEAGRVLRRMARNQRVLAASPAYITRRGMPPDVAALAAHDCLLAHENSVEERELALWTLRRGRDGATARVRVHGPLTSNSGEMVRDWCLAGRGVMLRSLWDIEPQLASGELLRVLPEWAMPDVDIQWLAPWRPKTPKRVRLLIDFLAERFRAEPWAAGRREFNAAAAPPGSRRTQ